ALRGQKRAQRPPGRRRAGAPVDAHAGRDEAPPPAASRHFRATDLVVVEVECYGGSDGSPAVSARLLNKKGQPLMELRAPPAPAKKPRVTLPLARLAPRTYVLLLDAPYATQSVHHPT